MLKNSLEDVVVDVDMNLIVSSASQLPKTLGTFFNLQCSFFSVWQDGGFVVVVRYQSSPTLRLFQLFSPPSQVPCYLLFAFVIQQSEMFMVYRQIKLVL
jgi:hypothetical protein